MCRNIKTLFNFEPPATDEEIRASSLQFVRKLSGFNSPSKSNQAAFDRAIEGGLGVAADDRDRGPVVPVAAGRARARTAARFGSGS